MAKKQYSIGWPSGYERGSPYQVDPAKTRKDPTITGKMRKGGLDGVPAWRGYLGPLTRSELDVAKTARIRGRR